MPDRCQYYWDIDSMYEDEDEAVLEEYVSLVCRLVEGHDGPHRLVTEDNLNANYPEPEEE